MREGAAIGSSGLKWLLSDHLGSTHAVTTAGTTTYCYDPNGSMTRRDPSGAAVYNFAYDAENRLVRATNSGLSGAFLESGGQVVIF